MNRNYSTQMRTSSGDAHRRENGGQHIPNIFDDHSDSLSMERRRALRLARNSIASQPYYLRELDGEITHIGALYDNAMMQRRYEDGTSLLYELHKAQDAYLAAYNKFEADVAYVADPANDCTCSGDEPCGYCQRKARAQAWDVLPFGPEA